MGSFYDYRQVVDVPLDVSVNIPISAPAPMFFGLDLAPASSGVVVSFFHDGAVRFFVFHAKAKDGTLKSNILSRGAVEFSEWIINGKFFDGLGLCLGNEFLIAYEDVPYIQGHRIIQQAFFTGAVSSLLVKESSNVVVPVFAGYVKKFCSLPRNEKPVELFSNFVREYGKVKKLSVSMRVLGDVADAFVLNLIGMASYFFYYADFGLFEAFCRDFLCAIFGLSVSDVQHVVKGVTVS